MADNAARRPQGTAECRRCGFKCSGAWDFSTLQGISVAHVGDCYQITGGFMCLTCIGANQIDIHQLEREDDDARRREDERIDAEIQERYESMYMNGELEMDPAGYFPRPRTRALCVGHRVYVRGSYLERAPGEKYRALKEYTIRAIFEHNFRPGGARSIPYVNASQFDGFARYYVIMMDDGRFFLGKRIIRR